MKTVIVLLVLVVVVRALMRPSGRDYWYHFFTGKHLAGFGGTS